VGGNLGAAISGGKNGGAVFGNNLATNDGEDLYPLSDDANYSGIHAQMGSIAFYTASDSFYDVDINRSEPQMYIDQSGNVGIGTAQTKRAKLVVDGDIYVSGKVKEGGRVMHFPHKELENFSIPLHVQQDNPEIIMRSTFYMQEKKEVEIALGIFDITGLEEYRPGVRTDRDSGDDYFAFQVVIYSDNGEEIVLDEFFNAQRIEDSNILITVSTFKILDVGAHEVVVRYYANVSSLSSFSATEMHVEKISLFVLEKDPGLEGVSYTGEQVIRVPTL
jgi:hypothetical protein